MTETSFGAAVKCKSLSNTQAVVIGMAKNARIRKRRINSIIDLLRFIEFPLSSFLSSNVGKNLPYNGFRDMPGDTLSIILRVIIPPVITVRLIGIISISMLVIIPIIMPVVIGGSVIRMGPDHYALESATVINAKSAAAQND